MCARSDRRRRLRPLGIHARGQRRTCPPRRRREKPGFPAGAPVPQPDHRGGHPAAGAGQRPGKAAPRATWVLHPPGLHGAGGRLLPLKRRKPPRRACLAAAHTGRRLPGARHRGSRLEQRDTRECQGDAVARAAGAGPRALARRARPPRRPAGGAGPAAGLRPRAHPGWLHASHGAGSEQHPHASPCCPPTAG